MTRRRLLTDVLALGLYLLCPSIRARAVPVASIDAQRARLIRLVPNQYSAEVVGKAFLRLMPTEAHPDVLFGRLLSALTEGNRASNAPDHELRNRLLRATSGDFEAQRTVNLDGWIVSLTEARLCALATLDRKLGH